MKKGRAQQVQAIFISDNPALAAGLDVQRMTTAERDTYEALEAAAARVQQSYTGAQVFFLAMNKYSGSQVVQLERWGITRYPAVRLWASYADGSEAYYNFEPPYPGATPDLSKLAPGLDGLYLGEFGNNSFLCSIFPPLCNLPAFAWLGIAAWAALRTTQATGAARLAWGAGAVLAGNEFLKRGGLNAVKELTSGAQQPNSLNA